MQWVKCCCVVCLTDDLVTLCPSFQNISLTLGGVWRIDIAYLQGNNFLDFLGIHIYSVTNWLTYCLITDWPTDLLNIDWPNDLQLIYWPLTDLLPYWPTDLQLTYWPTTLLTYWPTNLLTDLLTYWLTTDWTTNYWLTNLLTTDWTTDWTTNWLLTYYWLTYWLPDYEKPSTHCCSWEKALSPAPFILAQLYCTDVCNYCNWYTPLIIGMI